MTAQKVCGVCRNEFWTRGSRAKYCSPECRKLVNSLRVSQTLNSGEGKGGTKKLLSLKKSLLNIKEKVLDQDYEREIEEIMGGIKCPKDFKCYKSGLKEVCKVKYIVEGVVECLEENPIYCKFAISFWHSYFCTCHLRVYIAKKLKR